MAHSVFRHRADTLFAEELSVADIAARFGTPAFVYSRAAIEAQWRLLDNAFAATPHQLCYAVKANSNLAVLNLMARLGSGFDIVSLGELERVLAAGGDASKIVFSGLGKRSDEIERALEVGIACFNVESLPELERIADIAAAHGTQAPVSLRVNPDIDAGTHPYISTGLKENKFGVALADARTGYRRAAELASLRVVGVDCHIGSQLTDVRPLIDALDRVLRLTDDLLNEGIAIEHIDMGGGLGIRYQDESPPDVQTYAGAVAERLSGRPLKLYLEPGRFVVGNAGILLTRVEYLKHSEHRNFAVVDAAMNDLIRPSLYGAWQDIQPVQVRQGEAREYDVVGPVCESGDFLGKARMLTIAAGDLLYVASAGAYGFVMSSNYNSRPRAAEIMVDGDQMHLVRRRERIDELFAGECVIP